MAYKAIETASINRKALLLFADIIDSCKYSSVLGLDVYAEHLIEFRKTFKDLGNVYFPASTNKLVDITTVETRGDEGSIFCVNDEPAENLIYKAIRFAFELKGLLLIKTPDSSPRRMDVGIGIHFGRVALMIGADPSPVSGERAKDVVVGLDGFEINYAKRVESCSRSGRYSNIFLSKVAASLIDGSPIVFDRQHVQMKGISDSEEVFEVRSAFLEDMPYGIEDEIKESFVSKFSVGSDKLDIVKDPWLKCLALSVMESRKSKTTLPDLKKEYDEVLCKMIWAKPAEDDPIFIYWRAWHYDKESDYTKSLFYLKQLIDEFPDFIYARKKLAKVCWKISQTNSERQEKIFARNIAGEYIDRFRNYLTTEEIELFESIVRACQET